ncbi:MAG TPA: zinc ribbon domain-containing protein [Thermotogota bacterium]|jgi:hypothetical protein|nr:zinc-ribbon domain-containing protein [Thermotogota bacterium]NLH18846.1 zinc-ribbon domain-containing protein [Thermotogaceae bacterium]OQC32775.1 MAG: Double zinc ribbon [Thermotogota bacterium ADurb.Bin062]HNW46631.1 zinc ribbon domain-containing protein [Thermotogota bacterium]HOD90196.1 zinc ribbon domain-containing protein [Thermotogota bacterium]
MPLNVIIKELVEGLPSQVRSHFFSRSKKEKSISMVLDHAKELLKPVVHTLWNELEVKEQEVRAYVSQKLTAGVSQERILAELKAKEDPDQVTLFQLVYEEVKKQVEDEKFFIFKEVGERIADREIWNLVHARIPPDDRVMATVSGSLKSECLVKTAKQIIIVKKGISSLLKGSLQTSIQAIPIDQILDVSISGSMIGAVMSLKYLSGSTDFRFKKEYQTEMEGIILPIRERLKKLEKVEPTAPTPYLKAIEGPEAEIGAPEPQMGPEPAVSLTSTPFEEPVTKPRPVCPNCGKPVEPDAKFCGNCGTPLQKPVLVEEPSAFSEDTLEPEEPAPEVSKDPTHQE